MQAMKTHVAGVDVHKQVLVITALIGMTADEPKSYQFQCDTYTDDLEECGRKLLKLGVKDIAMESTGIYWRPVFNVWHRQGFEITLGNSGHMKNVPGRKTDMNDSHWIAQLHRFGLIRASYVPRVEFHKMRSLNRHRTGLVEDLARVKNRVQKVLEDGNVKIGSVLSNVFGVSGQAVLNAIANGTTDSHDLLAQITTDVKKPKEEILKSLKNCLTETHRFQVAEYLIQIKHLQENIQGVEKELAELLEPYQKQIKKLLKIPGVKLITAQGIIAEATTCMENFADDRKFGAWAGVAPGNHQSAGTRKRARSRHGNPALKKILVQVARGAVKKKNSYFMAKYRRLTLQLGSKNKALVAIANRLSRVVYHLLKNEDLQYKDLGALRGVDDKEKQIKNKIAQLKALGIEVEYVTMQKIRATKTIELTV
jgi:transposase